MHLGKSIYMKNEIWSSIMYTNEMKRKIFIKTIMYTL